MILADLHIHSKFSDGKLTIPQLVDFYGSRGFGCIAITDHVCETTTVIGKAGNWIGHSVTPAKHILYREILKSETERAWDQYRMIVIPGLEITKNSISNHRSAHMLALGTSEWLSADGEVVEIIKRIHDHGALAIAAHPVSTRKVEKQTFHLWDRLEELRHHFDAWEVASGPHLFDEVLKAKVRKVASSDLHAPQQMTSWKSVFECELHPEAILEAIKKQNVHFRFYEEKNHHEIMATDSLRARPDRPRLRPMEYVPSISAVS